MTVLEAEVYIIGLCFAIAFFWFLAWNSFKWRRS